MISFEPESDIPLLVAGIRDEFAGRPWREPAAHWPDQPKALGGLDEQAGGTWLAVDPDPAAPRVACVLNAVGEAGGAGAGGAGSAGAGSADGGSGRSGDPVRDGFAGGGAGAGRRRSRGVLPLAALAGNLPTAAGARGFDAFHLLLLEPGSARLWSWSGQHFDHRRLTPGTHLVVNRGLVSGEPPDGRWHTPRAARFWPAFASAPRPAPGPDEPVDRAWGAWLPLLDGDGLAPDAPGALVRRVTRPDGRLWHTSSISLLALGAADGLRRYDFTSAPGNTRSWYPVPVPGARPRG